MTDEKQLEHLLREDEKEALQRCHDAGPEYERQIVAKLAKALLDRIKGVRS